MEIAFTNGCIVTWNANQQPTYAQNKENAVTQCSNTSLSYVEKYKFMFQWNVTASDGF